MLRKLLCPVLICAVLLLSSCALADSGRCLPWYDVTWTDSSGAGTVSATIYVGVYECSGSLDLSDWPVEVRGILRPVDESWADALWQKVINDCWSFYGVYPEMNEGPGGEKCVFDLPMGMVTVTRGADGSQIAIRASHAE